MLFAKRQIMTASAVVLLSVSVRADLSARWELHADFDDRSIPGAIGNCVFKQEGQRLSGTCEDAALSGEVSGETVTFRLIAAATHATVAFSGMLDDDDTVIVGRFIYPDKGGGSFLAIRSRREPSTPR